MLKSLVTLLLPFYHLADTLILARKPVPYFSGDIQGFDNPGFKCNGKIESSLGRTDSSRTCKN